MNSVLIQSGTGLSKLNLCHAELLISEKILLSNGKIANLASSVELIVFMYYGGVCHKKLKLIHVQLNVTRCHVAKTISSPIKHIQSETITKINHQGRQRWPAECNADNIN